MSQIAIDKLEASIARHQSLVARTDRIVDRLLPLEGRAPHGFYQPEAFADRMVVRYWRLRLHYYIKAQLRAKLEGGLPRIGVPKNSEHLFGPGDAMFDVAAFIDAQNASAA